MSDEESWVEAKLRYPAGSNARGRVKARFQFGVFLELDDAPGALGFLDIASYRPDPLADEPVPLPEVGEFVEGVVAIHVDRDKQIKIRVGRPFWED
ncbi:hypothetical protein ACFY3G_22165 [Streptomyces phaeochromogenes]|uniref:hypothetical protein n=1 Tax=Streptomyces phaeochromogenes TaxID=1923 RepID=UPI00369654E3